MRDYVEVLEFDFPLVAANSTERPSSAYISSVNGAAPIAALPRIGMANTQSPFNDEGTHWGWGDILGLNA